MLFYVLFIIGVGLVLKVYQLHQNATAARITYPSATSYLSLIKDLTFLRANPSAKTQLQTRFMTFIAELGARSLDEPGSGIAYFKLPDLTPVFILSNKSAIQQLYSKANETKFGQRPFFQRLAVILGSGNLMSSILGSDTHSRIRQSILSRNESNRPHVANMVADFFKEYELEQGQDGRTLSEVMDRLSRRVLLTTYFGAAVIKPFEKFYHPSLTKELITCLFSLDPIQDDEKQNLLFLRDKTFKLGCQVIFSSDEITKQLMEQQSWLNYLLRVRVLMNSDVNSQLEELGINSEEELTAVQCELLIKYSVEHADTTLLSTMVRDVVNESLFIPLLGFDATATALITALRIALQDKRVYSIIKQEIQQKISAGESFELHSPWDAQIEKGVSYAEAVLLEALRLAPPAPIVPEIVHETIDLDMEGTSITLPPGALVFIPMQGVHTHAQYFPDIVLSSEGQRIFGKKTISANDIFPERWHPKNGRGVLYNAHYFAETHSSDVPRIMEKEGQLLPFKTGARRCPGLRIAMTEIMALFRMLATYKFELTAEEHLELRFNYETPLQRNGGMGVLKIRPRKHLELREAPSPYAEHSVHGFNFFPEPLVAKDRKIEPTSFSISNSRV
ncbi:cytochrome P450 [Fluoribacter gormanii]|uniref:Cytochrome P450 n=1 Tax=Fluoribacter gormanii TaxID=464 RepID=A0A377GJL3_9GAMM|nr:cytochrome P450 [Fluoribacter gormanii]KTD00909.1 Cytochrome P450 [Fluoribacter gormanii]MCW8471863.1 cytochrome P450 [Fluoribacter gormanii]SIQ81390.1 Cytochrome P450 [Fluoribacter gormanii]STO25027.1 Cytochrome P450 [Fluoribacter gormanii]